MQYDLRNYVVWAQEFKIQRCVESALVSYIIVFLPILCVLFSQKVTQLPFHRGTQAI